MYWNFQVFESDKYFDIRIWIEKSLYNYNMLQMVLIFEEETMEYLGYNVNFEG